MWIEVLGPGLNDGNSHTRFQSQAKNFTKEIDESISTTKNSSYFLAAGIMELSLSEASAM